ncbi:MAG: type II secretion system protein [Phycisphaerae bacterium]|nr:type II secretion system protein [Phycisphaerae bacterium]
MKHEFRNPHRLLTTGYRLPATGFTLVELLIVIAIIVLLAAIGIGVGYRLTSAADVEKTKANMAIIMTAVNDYYDQTGEYPGNKDTDPGSGEIYELRIRRESGGAVLASYTRFVEKVGSLDTKAFNKDNPTEPDPGNNDFTIFHFVDPSGRVIQYFPSGGLGNAPILVAPGDDGLYGTDDDLRSDK